MLSCACVCCNNEQSCNLGTISSEDNRAGTLSLRESVLSRTRQGKYKQDLSFPEIFATGLGKFQIYSLQDQAWMLGTEVSTKVER